MKSTLRKLGFGLALAAAALLPTTPAYPSCEGQTQEGPLGYALN